MLKFLCTQMQKDKKTQIDSGEEERAKGRREKIEIEEKKKRDQPVCVLVGGN